MSMLQRFVNQHWWVPLLRGSDGLTGRERRRMADQYAATIGNRHTGRPLRGFWTACVASTAYGDCPYAPVRYEPYCIGHLKIARQWAASAGEQQ